jgi:hypothetical protein
MILLKLFHERKNYFKNLKIKIKIENITSISIKGIIGKRFYWSCFISSFSLRKRKSYILTLWMKLFNYKISNNTNFEINILFIFISIFISLWIIAD